MGEVCALAKTLVSIPSHKDETAVGDTIEDWLREETDADIIRDQVGNVLARKGSNETSLALVGHHDVVAPVEEQIENDKYVVEEHEGRLYGRGTADMKGSVAAAMCAFRDADPTCELVFASFVGEEVGGVGAKYAIEHEFQPDYAIVGEGSTNYSEDGVTDIVFAHRGRREHRMIARGNAAHASEPVTGENAIYRAVNAIEMVREIGFPPVDLRGHQISGSLAVTGIRDSGNASNVIPDECTVIIDERSVPGVDLDFEKVKSRSDIEWEIDEGFPPMQSKGDFADRVREIAADVQGNEPKLVTKPHATDAGRLSQAGTNCIVCGASEPGEAHTANESASIEVLERCYRIYKEIATQL